MDLETAARDLGALVASRTGKNPIEPLPRRLAVVAGQKSTPFHGADGAGALQGTSQQWPSIPENDDQGASEARFGVRASELSPSDFCILYSSPAFLTLKTQNLELFSGSNRGSPPTDLESRREFAVNIR